jgi:hypothetical protein
MRVSLPATFLLGVVAGFAAAALVRPNSALAQSKSALPAAATATVDEIAAFRSLLPPQGHAMADVENHFVKTSRGGLVDFEAASSVDLRDE